MAKIRIEDAIAEYAAHLRGRLIGESTIRNVVSSLNRISQVTGNIWLDKLDARLMDRVFATYLWQPSTMNNKMRIFRAFFRWVRTRRYAPLDWEPLLGWRNVTVPEKKRTRIPRSEWGSLFDQCVHPQERIVLGTGLYLFLRASEQQALQIKHVHLQTSEIEVWRSKTKEWDRMPISAELEVIVRDHIIWLATQGCAAADHYLIPSRNRDLDHDENSRWIKGTGTINPLRPLSKPHRTVQRILERNGYLVKGEGEHTLRRSGARAYFDFLSQEGYDYALRKVQVMLGHKHAMTTEIYLGLDEERFVRNRDLAGRPMFPTGEQSGNVIHLFGEQSWQSGS